MHVVVVGASGRIGSRVVDTARARGHRVTAVVRDPRSVPSSPGMAVVAADVEREDTAVTLPADADLVVFAVGSRGTGSTVVRSEGLARVLDAVTPGGPRVVVLSGTGVAISRNVSIVRRLTLRFLVQKRLRNVLNDMERMEDELLHRDVDWTVVRCTSVRDGARGGLVVSRAGTESRHAPVGLDDLAAWVVDHAPASELTRSAVALAGSS